MNRKDGREPVTEHPVTAMDMVEVIPAGEFVLPDGVISCRVVDVPDGSWMDDDPSSDDFDDWGA